MNAYRLKLILLSGLILIAGCDITFKRKSKSVTASQVEITQPEKDTKDENNKSELSFRSKDTQLIKLYYSDKANAAILKDMSTHTRLSKKQANKLTESKHIANNIQVMPLPLELERMLSPLPRYALRVQIGKRVILMNVNSRRILDIIKI